MQKRAFAGKAPDLRMNSLDGPSPLKRAELIAEIDLALAGGGTGFQNSAGK
jgi:hypothetical protein